MDLVLGQERLQGYRAATAPEPFSEKLNNAVFRHATDPSKLQEMDPTVRPQTGAISPTRHSFDSDLKNYFRHSRRYSLPSEPGELAGLPLFDFARNRYGMKLIPISPPKEKEKRSLTKIFGGPWQRKPTISAVMNPQHLQHVDFNPNTGRFVGLPKEWEQTLTSGSSSERWDALIHQPIYQTHPSLIHSLEDDIYVSERTVDPKRLTTSSTAETFYSDISRYRRPAERPPSFPSIGASTNEDFFDAQEMVSPPRRVLPTTPRPLPKYPQF